MYNAADIYILYWGCVCVYSVSEHNALLYQLLISITCMHYYLQANGHGSQVAQPMRSVGGHQQPSLPAAATTASEHLWAVAAENRAAPSHSHTVTIFTNAGSMYCPSGYICLHLAKKEEADSTRERETGISSDPGSGSAKKNWSTHENT